MKVVCGSIQSGDFISQPNQFNLQGDYRRIFSVYVGATRDMGRVEIVIRSKNNGQKIFSSLPKATRYLQENGASDSGIKKLERAAKKEFRAVRKRGFEVGGEFFGFGGNVKEDSET